MVLVVLKVTRALEWKLKIACVLISTTLAGYCILKGCPVNCLPSPKWQIGAHHFPSREILITVY